METLLELLSSGMTFGEVLEDYEDLEREDLQAALLRKSTGCFQNVTQNGGAPSRETGAEKVTVLSPDARADR